MNDTSSPVHLLPILQNDDLHVIFKLKL